MELHFSLLLVTHHKAHLFIYQSLSFTLNVKNSDAEDFQCFTVILIQIICYQVVCEIDSYHFKNSEDRNQIHNILKY